jgi:predicted NUDIX family phosphoesterase
MAISTILTIQKSAIPPSIADSDGLILVDKQSDDYKALMSAGVWFGPRPFLEVAEGWTHPIGYVMIVRKSDGAILTYKRPDKGTGESRLAGKRSVGFGGHVEIIDYATDDDGSISFENTLLDSIHREIREELPPVDTKHGPELIGLINDKTNPVGQVHLGFLYRLTISDRVVEELYGCDSEVEDLQFVVPSPDMDLSLFENWSVLALNHLIRTTDDPIL